MKKFFLVMCLILAQNIFAQAEDNSTQPENIIPVKNITEIDSKPSFPGGISKFYQFILQNYNVPKKEKKSGQILLTFIVETDGTLSNITVFRGINPVMDQEAIRVLKLTPNWIPGKIGEKAVRVKYSLPMAMN